jgi:hypothetical protein
VAGEMKDVTAVIAKSGKEEFVGQHPFRNLTKASLVMPDNFATLFCYFARLYLR